MIKNLIASTILGLIVASSLIGQTVITGPPTVHVGQPIKFSVQDAEAGDLISWQVLSPRGGDTTVINTEFGIEFIVDSGCRFTGRVEVLCTVVNFGTEKFIQEVIDCEVEGDIPDPTPPDPEPIPPDPEPDWSSDVAPDRFDNIGQRIDTAIHDSGGLTRRAELAGNFATLAAKMKSYDIRTPSAAKEFLVNFASRFRPEWNDVFAILSTDGAGRPGMVWSEVIDYYVAISAGIKG